jgi:hypothetical protein
MSLLTKTIFLKENEKNIFQALYDQRIETKVFENKLADLFNRVYNNYVGYYIFRQDGIVYKLIVLPKILDKNDVDVEKDFVNYLIHYYRIKSKYKDLYKEDATKYISDSLLSLAFDDNKDEKNSHKLLDKFEFYKYKSILENIEKFFKKHKNYKKINIDYKSQGIKYKLNLAKNIKELDKTKIHQTQTIDMMYSMIATITYNALKIFISKRLKVLNRDEKNGLQNYSKKINNFIAKKYNIDRNYKLTLSKLNSSKVKKVFTKKKETKQLLVDIKSLFGFEQMYKDDEVSVSNRYDLTTTSFFIDPILFYEWYVYDILKEYTSTNDKIILFDKIDAQTTRKYKVALLEDNKEKKSKLDYVIVDENENIKIVIDAKWKEIDRLTKIDSSDYLKLKFDSELLTKDSYKTISYLVYPNIKIENGKVNISIDENIYFNFNILQIDMDFDKQKLDFVHNYEELSTQIKKEQKEVIVKTHSEQLTDDIKENRTDLIVKLLNEESLENKEEILSELDTKLIEYAEKLNEDIEEQLTDEVIEILENYKDDLEEDSIKFLKSSSSIYSYYKDKNYEHFDYSMPGSGLWKLVELELNTSFSWFLRIKSNVCNNTCPWTNISNARRSITQDLASGKRVKLNQYEHENNTKLQGLMLGGINLLLEDSNTVSEFDKISELDRTFFPQFLIGFVRQVIVLRNEHAHIKAMSLEKFEELYNVLFNFEDSNVVKFLEFKKRIKKEIMLNDG